MDLIKEERRKIIVVVDREELELNFQRCRAVYRNGGRIRDVSFGAEPWRGSAVYRRLSENGSLRGELSAAFVQRFGELAFACGELKPGRFVELCCFQGWPRKFYDAIPYSLRADGLGVGFKRRARHLRFAAALPALYEEAGLPPVKSIRWAVFHEPGFAFYLPELALLWRVINNIDLFCCMLRKEWIWDLLAVLVNYAEAAELFMLDYINRRSLNMLMKVLQTHVYELGDYVSCYSALSPAARRFEQKCWGKHFETFPRSDLLTGGFSLPNGDHGLFDGQFGGLYFTAMRSGADLQKAGRELNNCLHEYETDTIYEVLSYGKPIAAIELRNRKIAQARGHSNANIAEGSELQKAIMSWALHFGLGWECRLCKGKADDEVSRAWL